MKSLLWLPGLLISALLAGCADSTPPRPVPVRTGESDEPAPEEPATAAVAEKLAAENPDDVKAIEELSAKAIARNADGAIISVDLREVPVPSEKLAHLKSFGDLEVLKISSEGVTDEGLEHLAGLVTLKELSLEATSVTDAGLDKLAGLKELKVLNLRNCKGLTDKSLSKLKNLPNLEEVQLLNNKFSDEAIDGLQKGLPNLKVTR